MSIPAPVTRTGTAPMPVELDRWNWGAFLLNWVWGVGNNTFLALLTLVPFVGFVMPFVLGAKGNAWAWRNGRWDSVEHFRRVQRRWALWGVVIWLGGFALVAGTFGTLFYLLSHSDAYALGVARVSQSPEAQSALGTPISFGWPSGSVSIAGASGDAALDFAATGPKGAGHVSLQAVKRTGTWSLTSLRLLVDGQTDPIDLLRDNRAELKIRPAVASFH